MARQRPLPLVLLGGLALLALLLAVATFTTAARRPADSLGSGVAEPEPVLALAPPPQPVDAEAVLAEAERRRQNGQLDQAVAALSAAANAVEGAAGERVWIRLAALLIEADRSKDALDTLSALQARGASADNAGLVSFLRGRAQRQGGDCQGALASFEAARPRVGGLAPYADLLAADCAAKLDNRGLQRERAAAALDAAPNRQARIDALEHLVDSAARRGDQAAALEHTQRLVEQAGTRTYRATTLANVGRFAAALGRRDDAARANATVVAELPETPAAGTALSALAELGELGRIGPDQAAVVAHLQGRHAQAEQELASAIDAGLSTERAAAARYYRGLALIQLGRDDEAVASLRKSAEGHPTGAQAPVALLRAGRVMERAGRWTDASDLYQLAAQTYPDSAAGQQAEQHLAFTLLQREALPESAAAADRLASRAADPQWQGLGLLWASKAYGRAGDQAQAQAALRRAADLDRDHYGGLRAAALLVADGSPMHAAAPLRRERLQPAEDERTELDAWMAGRGAGLSALDAEYDTEPAYQRAQALYQTGARLFGDWELEELRARSSADAPRLVQIARFAARQGQHRLALLNAREAQRAAGQPAGALPRMVRRLLYPVPFAEPLAASSERQGVDPLLLLALIRKESVFDPAARSSAGAVGLAQVIPSTGQGIARALGRGDFRNEDLLNPTVSIEFGAYYLGSQLKAYGGRIYPSLAAYNAGGANANRWLQELPSADADVWAERIPFSETSGYVQQVYENYLNYRALYGP
ncbi:MAG: transglycosylase SLT domain-containing protein [Chloroflexota bacterium]